jgi:hypothetical protein
MGWKLIERASIILGVVFAAVSTYYTAATYYGWNTPSTSTPSNNGATLTPPWWWYFSIAIGLVLIATAWAMMLARHPRKRNRQLKLLFDPRCYKIHGPGI